MKSDPQKNRYLTRIRTILIEEIGDKPIRIFLFGSWVNGNARASSDVDVALEGPGPLDPALLARFRERLEESTIPYKVDLVDLHEVDPSFRKAVFPGAIEWKISTRKLRR
jgi:uncharacterized protein